MSTSVMLVPVAQLRAELLTDFEQLEAISGDWDRLWKSAPAAEIFQSFAWARAWWRAYGSAYSVHCLVIYEGDAIVGILPLARKNKRLQFLGAPQADYTDILCEEHRALEVITTAFSALHNSGGWQECRLEHIPTGSRIARYWPKAAPVLRRHSALGFGYYCSTILVPPDTPDLLSKIARKKKMREHANKLAKLGLVSFRFIESKQEAREHLQRFFRYHARRRILIAERSHCHEPEFRALLEGLVDELDPKDELRLSCLEVNGTAVAYQLGFHVTQKYTLYQQTFDVNSWDQHPGNVLLRHVLLFAAEKSDSEFDFTIGIEPYKTRYTNRVKHNLTLYFEPATLAGRVRAFMRKIQGRLYHTAIYAKVHLKQYPDLYDRVEALRAWIFDSAADQLRSPFLLLKQMVSLWTRARRWLWLSRDRILFRFEGNALAEHFQDKRGNVEIVLARLADIADLLIDGCDFPDNLDTWRERLGRGDQLVIVRESGKPLIAVWTTSDLSALSAKMPGIDPDSSRIVYEHWTAKDADLSGSYSAALAFLVRQTASLKQNLWVCCPAAAAVQKQLAGQGFSPKFRLRDWALLWRIRRQRIAAIIPESGRPAADPVCAEDPVECVSKPH